MPPPLNFPPFVILHPQQPGVVFDLAYTQEQAETKLARLNGPDNTAAAGFEIAPNAAQPAEPGILEKIFADLVRHCGSEVEAHTAIYELIHRPPAPPPKKKPDAAPAPAAEPPPPPPDCPFEIGQIVKDSHSATLGQVREVLPAEPSGTLGMKLALPETSRLHFVPAANYGDFVLEHKAVADMPDDLQPALRFGADPVPAAPVVVPPAAKSPEQIAKDAAKARAIKDRKPPRTPESLLKKKPAPKK